MLYRRKRNSIDPTRINNYNKFLTTLDQKYPPGLSHIPIHSICTEKKEKQENPDNPEKIEKLSEKSSDVETEFRNEINKIIEKINQNYTHNNHSSTNFTGYNPSDSCCITNSDPNYYRDIMNRSRLLNYTRPYISPIKLDLPKQYSPSVTIKETITIETEI